MVGVNGFGGCRRSTAAVGEAGGDEVVGELGVLVEESVAKEKRFIMVLFYFMFFYFKR